MITVRPAHDRGHADHGWLDSRHTFSFANYYDPAHMGFRQLRVINEDRVQPKGGFGTHSHQDMEIITYVLSGSLAHQDSIGNSSTIGVGEVRRMTAGTGIQHSEFNASTTDPVHFLQIWILPEQKDLAPSYEQIAFPQETQPGQWQHLAGRDRQPGIVQIHQDVNLYNAFLKPGETLTSPVAIDRHAWLQLIRGQVRLNGVPLTAGDGVAIGDEPQFTVTADSDAEILLFDLA